MYIISIVYFYQFYQRLLIGLAIFYQRLLISLVISPLYFVSYEPDPLKCMISCVDLLILYARCSTLRMSFISGDSLRSIISAHIILPPGKTYVCSYLRLLPSSLWRGVKITFCQSSSSLFLSIKWCKGLVSAVLRLFIYYYFCVNLVTSYFFIIFLGHIAVLISCLVGFWNRFRITVSPLLFKYIVNASPSLFVNFD